MNVVLVIHIVAASLGLISGYVALYASKGAPLHRRAGRLFVTVMFTMTATGVVIAAVRGVAPTINIPAGLLTAYFVYTGLTAVRPLARGGALWDRIAMGVALGVGAVTLVFAFEAVALGGTKDGMPAFPYFLFGIMGVLASVGDGRMIRAGALRGVARVSRHLWRMSFALLIAALSFFLGQSDEFPRALRIPALLATPVLAVLVTMLYWVWRVGLKRTVRGLLVARAPETA